MTSAEIEVGKYYHFEFQGTWSEFSGDYTVTGYTTPDTISLIDATVSLFKIYFENLGMDRDKYNAYINSSSKVIIANKVTSKNPISVDENEFVYLPVPIINFQKSYLYLNAVKLNLTVHSGIKYFEKETERSEFIKKTLIDIKDTIDKMDDYSGEMISVDCEEIDTITTQSDIDRITSARKLLVNNRLISKMQQQIVLEASERNMYERLEETKVEKEHYETLSTNLSSKINEVEALRVTNTAEAETLNKVKENMIKMLNMLITGETTIGSLGNTGIEAFNNLYDLAKNT